MTKNIEGNMVGLAVENITKSYENTRALEGVSFNVKIGEIVAILGPSGCGKSTLLNIIAGLVEPDTGLIFWNRENLASLPPHKRGFGLMFQDYQLFPHKNVRANIAFGLEMAHWKKHRIDNRVNKTLKVVNLVGYAHRDVNTLSGGEQQRVALARSLAPHPELLMLDEPLGSIDRALRDHLLVELGTILKSVEQTALYVTHDQEEAFMLSDRVIVINQGKIAQSGTPQEIYRRPASEFVARFLGQDNIFDGQYQKGILKTELGNFEINESGHSLPFPPNYQTTCLKFLFRPDSMHLDGTGTHHIKPTILDIKFRGSLNRAIVQINGRNLNFDFPASANLPKAGESISLSFFPEETIQIFL